MLTLHKTIEESRAILKWGGIIVGGIIFLLIFFNVGKSLKELFFPTPLPPPTVSFGKLPKINFLQNATDKNLTYTLNTLSGRLPAFKDRANVYKMVVFEPNLLALNNTKEKVGRVGFLSAETALSTTTYQWSSADSKRIVVDILSQKFDLVSDYFSQPDVLSAANLPDETTAIKVASEFLTGLSSFPTDIDSAKNKTILLAIKDSKVIPATSLSNTKIIRVDFFQGDIDKAPILYPHPPGSLINVSVASGDNNPKIVESHFFHQNPSENSATYPIKTAGEAFSELKSGKAYIASYFSANEVLIKNVYLGYYMEENPQDYLMPVVVFEGDNGFFAYVSAVKDSWINQE